MPFLHFEESYVKFRGNKGQRAANPSLKEVTRKTRPIRYACRADAYIYSRYRAKLTPFYEQRLVDEGLEASVLAYRKIPLHPKQESGPNKSNINFAKDAFDAVRSYGDCLVVTADISSYFDNIDHELLENRWREILGVEELPEDHQVVFKNVTRYSWVDYRELCRKLGCFGKRSDDREGFLVNRKEMPIKIADNPTLRSAFSSKTPSGKRLLQVNRKKRGIPQGSPISDILANMYLLDFDLACKDYASRNGGTYFRYSDDILMIFPDEGKIDHLAVTQFLQGEIRKAGPKLVIQDKKCASLKYYRAGPRQRFTPLSQATNKFTSKQTFKMRNGLEYLGFRYDGKDVFIRDSTISNLYRKIARNSVAKAIQHRKNYPNLDVDELVKRMPFNAFYETYGQVEDFNEKAAKAKGAFKHLTFRSYAKKAAATFGEHGTKIMPQFSNTREKARRRFEKSVRKAAKWYPPT